MEWVEYAGFASGALGVWLTIRQKIACFPVGILNVCLSAWLFWEQKLYADTLQQCVYLVLLVFGWMEWGKKKEVTPLPVSRLNIKESLLLLTATAAGTALLFKLLRTYTDAHYPLPDSFATCLAFTAQYLIAKKKIENWILWVTVNVIYIVIYSRKDLHLYVVLNSIYLLLSFYGFASWKKEQINSSNR
jgi:nicotinamide mononucleotide transporter